MQTQGYKTSPGKLEQIGYYTLTGNILGKGNFARVEEAHHSILNVKVAIKMIDTSKIKEEEYVTKNLQREARILCSLAHPSIMYLYETFHHGPMYYLVCEVALGGNLCAFLKRQRAGRLDERLTKQFARQLISALAYMHSLGFIHRDLKMENVMLDSKWRQVKIVDFGLSSAWTAGQLLTTHCGSPEYAAPELFDANSSYGSEVDLWSLGVVLYGMAAGCLPFAMSKSGAFSSGDRRIRLLSQVNKGYQVSHDNILAHMSVDFRHMISQLLTVSVEERITIDELCFHPWVTSRQKHMMTNYSYRQLDAEEQRKIIGHISKILTMDHDTVKHEIKSNRLGQIGGLFNLIVHRKCMDYFKIDTTNAEESKPHQGKPKIKTVAVSDQPKQTYIRTDKPKEIKMNTLISNKVESMPKQIPNFQKPTYSSAQAATLTYASLKPIINKSKPTINMKLLTHSRQGETTNSKLSSASFTPIAEQSVMKSAPVHQDRVSISGSKPTRKLQEDVPTAATRQPVLHPINKTSKLQMCSLQGSSYYPDDISRAPVMRVDQHSLSTAKNDPARVTARMKQMNLVNRLSMPSQKTDHSCKNSTKFSKPKDGNQHVNDRNSVSKSVHLPLKSVPVAQLDLRNYDNPTTSWDVPPRRQISSSCHRQSDNHDGYLSLGIHTCARSRDEQVPPYATPVKQKNVSLHNNWEFTGIAPNQMYSSPTSIVSSECTHNTLTETQRHWQEKVAYANEKLLKIETGMETRKFSSNGGHGAQKLPCPQRKKSHVSWTDDFVAPDYAHSHNNSMGNDCFDTRSTVPKCQMQAFEDVNRNIGKRVPAFQIDSQSLQSYMSTLTRKEQDRVKGKSGFQLPKDHPTTDWEDPCCTNHFTNSQDRPKRITGRGDHLTKSEEYILWSRLPHN